MARETKAERQARQEVERVEEQRAIAEANAEMPLAVLRQMARAAQHDISVSVELTADDGVLVTFNFFGCEEREDKYGNTEVTKFYGDNAVVRLAGSFPSSPFQLEHVVSQLDQIEAEQQRLLEIQTRRNALLDRLTVEERKLLGV